MFFLFLNQLQVFHYYKIANELEVDLPVGMTEKGFSAQEAKGKYLPFYNNEKLEAVIPKLDSDYLNNYCACIWHPPQVA